MTYIKCLYRRWSCCTVSFFLPYCDIVSMVIKVIVFVDLIDGFQGMSFIIPFLLNKWCRSHFRADPIIGFKNSTRILNTSVLILDKIMPRCSPISFYCYVRQHATRIPILDFGAFERRVGPANPPSLFKRYVVSQPILHLIVTSKKIILAV